MKNYSISIGTQGSTDSTFKINEKEYGIESRAWNLIAFAQAGSVTPDNIGNYLAYIYDNFDEDLINIAEHDCYCGSIKKGQTYDRTKCDLGCTYPGA